jgi:acyl-CoA thioester hydrolase
MQIDYTALPLTGEKTIPAEYLDFLGHMNVMWYTHLFNEATFAFYDSFGFGVDYHTNSGNGSMALTQHVSYLREIRIGDHITIRTRMLGYSEKRFHYIHFMLRDDARLSATMEILGIHTDMSTRRASPLPPVVTAAFDELLAEHSKLDWQPPLSGVVAP